SLERLVALTQRMLDASRIGDVEIAQEDVAVGQRYRHRLQNRAIATYQLRIVRAMRGEAGDDAPLRRGPIAAVVEERRLLLDGVPHMRLALEVGGGELPHLRIGGIGELQPAVAAEDGDRLV